MMIIDPTIANLEDYSRQVADVLCRMRSEQARRDYLSQSVLPELRRYPGDRVGVALFVGMQIGNIMQERYNEPFTKEIHL